MRPTKDSSLLAALEIMALGAGIQLMPIHEAREGGTWKKQPINTGRRAEKDAAALAKAQAKRDRKAAKRRGEA